MAGNILQIPRTLPHIPEIYYSLILLSFDNIRPNLSNRGRDRINQELKKYMKINSAIMQAM